MADVSVTATSVAVGSDTVLVYGILGATATAGQTVYLDSATATYKLGDANASATTSTIKGIAMNGGASGQPVAVAVGGSITCGFTATAGLIYVQSATAGGIAPSADLASGWYTSIVGVASSSSVLKLVLNNTGCVT